MPNEDSLNNDPETNLMLEKQRLKQSIAIELGLGVPKESKDNPNKKQEIIHPEQDDDSDSNFDNMGSLDCLKFNEELGPDGEPVTPDANNDV